MQLILSCDIYIYPYILPNNCTLLVFSHVSPYSVFTSSSETQAIPYIYGGSSHTVEMFTILSKSVFTCSVRLSMDTELNFQISLYFLPPSLLGSWTYNTFYFLILSFLFHSIEEYLRNTLLPIYLIFLFVACFFGCEVFGTSLSNNSKRTKTFLRLGRLFICRPLASNRAFLYMDISVLYLAGTKVGLFYSESALLSIKNCFNYSLWKGISAHLSLTL